MKNCLACAFRRWKSKIIQCIWQLKTLYYKPVIEIVKTKRFSVLSVIH